MTKDQILEFESTEDCDPGELLQFLLNQCLPDDVIEVKACFLADLLEDLDISGDLWRF